MSATDQNPAPGRPRDRAIDGAIVDAARALLAEGGLVAMTMEAVAKRAKIGKQTLYRRYPSRLPLLADVMGAISVERAGGADARVVDLIAGAYAFAESGAGRDVMRALLSDAAGDPAAMAMVYERFVAARLDGLTAALMREGPMDRDAARLRAQLAYGLMWYRLAFALPGAPADADQVAGLLFSELARPAGDH
ncbi:MAG: TetR/AcrR family transcriptional regulator [Pseudomonadota bacterium]